MQTMTAPDVRRVLEDEPDAVIINVLDEETFQRQHIPGSKNVPVDAPDFEQRADALASAKDEPVIVYCASQDCPASERAAERLEQAGYTRVLDFAGGMEEWAQHGFPVESGG